MNIALIAATRKEIQPTMTYLSERIYLRRHQRVEIIITGVGLMNTTYCLAKQFSREKPTLAIQAGIAGTLHPIYAPGMVVSVKEDFVGDLGVMENDEWMDVFDLGLADENDIPYYNKKLINPHRDILNKLQVECVRSISVNQVSTSSKVIRKMKEKYMPVIESMEGAAFHYVCLMEKIPFIQLRAISNMVGERNKTCWKINEAITSLNNELIKYINQVTDIY
jgi:futalosine hydrolase